MSWMAEGWSTGGLAGCQGAVNNGTQARNQNKGGCGQEAQPMGNLVSVWPTAKGIRRNKSGGRAQPSENPPPGWWSPKQRPGLRGFKGRGREQKQDPRIRNSIILGTAVNMNRALSIDSVSALTLTHLILIPAHKAVTTHTLLIRK